MKQLLQECYTQDKGDTVLITHNPEKDRHSIEKNKKKLKLREHKKKRKITPIIKVEEVEDKLEKKTAKRKEQRDT